MTTPNVTLLAVTAFDAATAKALTGWETEAEGGQALAEYSGRSCYSSWTRPNPATATNAGYLAHILEVGHGSVLEHGTATFQFANVSRSLTHELIRHRAGMSYSQLSQRFVVAAGDEYVTPPLFRGDDEAGKILQTAWNNASAAYEALVLRAGQILDDCGAEAGTARRKQAREAARAVLPNMTPTAIVVTGNYRAFRHFIAMRATEHADVEIRELAVECLRQLQRVASNVFADFTISTLPDGTDVAASCYAGVS